ncbi:MAG: MlaD family protein [Kiloniellales bacterium]|nr:MlaD family protein [Kiloniellales bacterium]
MRLANLGANRAVAFLSGLFVLLGAGVLAGWLYFQVVKPGQRAPYFIFLSDVTGIRPGTEVRVNGYPIGQVTNIEPDLDINRIEFRVDIVVDKIWPIPVDSTITISTDGILSTPVLALDPGNTETLLAEGALIPTLKAPPNITERITRLVDQEIAPTLRTFMATMKDVQVQIDENAPALLADARLVLSKTAATVNSLEGEIEALAAGMGDAGELMSKLNEEENVERFKSLIGNLEATAINLRGASEELGRILGSSQELIDSSGRILRENEAALKNTLADSEFAMESIATSINIVLQNLERTTREIAALAGKLNANPSVILTGEPEKEDPFK